MTESRWERPSFLALVLGSLKKTSQGCFALLVIFLVIDSASVSKSGLRVLQVLAVLSWVLLERDHSFKDLRKIFTILLSTRKDGRGEGDEGGERDQGGGGGEEGGEGCVEIVEMGRGKERHQNPLHSGDGAKSKEVEVPAENDLAGREKEGDEGNLDERKKEALMASSAVNPNRRRSECTESYSF